MYDGTITQTYPDPYLVESFDLLDGGHFYLLIDPEPESPEEWDDPASLVLTRQPRIGGGYSIGQPRTDIHHALLDAVDRWEHGDPKVARYMRLMHDVEVLTVSLRGCSQSDWADGYLILDNLDTTHGEDYIFVEGEREEILEECAKVWRSYFAGDVYGYIRTDADDETVGCCYGFYELEDQSRDDFLGELLAHEGLTLEHLLP